MTIRAASGGLLTMLFVAMLAAPTWAESGKWAIVVHGGAGGWPGRSPEETKALEKDIRQALEAGAGVLSGGGASLEAVETAIKVLEDSPRFNSARGGVFNAAGRHQLDASIMEGRERRAGAVAAIGVAKNPIAVARRVMTDTPHVLLADQGADAFARQIGVELVEPDYFWTPATRRDWEASKPKDQQEEPTTSALPSAPHHYGTVGCVALDTAGDLAAGTSTGGLQGKRVGRIGDSPIVGAGTYADNRAGAISCTGVGELFIRNAIAYDILARARYGVNDLGGAIDYHLEEQLDPGTGGVIVVSPEGEMFARFNTDAMPRGLADSTGRMEVAIDKP